MIWQWVSCGVILQFMSTNLYHLSPVHLNPLASRPTANPAPVPPLCARPLLPAVADPPAMCLQSCESCLDMWRYYSPVQSRSFEPLFSAQSLESATVSAFFLRPLLLALAGPHGNSPFILRISDGPVQILFPSVPPTFQPTFLSAVLRIHACSCIQL